MTEKKHDDLPSTVDAKKPDKPKTSTRGKSNQKQQKQSDGKKDAKPADTKAKEPDPIQRDESSDRVDDAQTTDQSDSVEKADDGQTSQEQDHRGGEETSSETNLADDAAKTTENHHIIPRQCLNIKSSDEIFSGVIQIAIPVARTGDYIRRRRGTDVRHMTDKQKRGYNYLFEGMKGGYQTESGHEINTPAKAFKKLCELVAEAVEGK